MRQFDSTTRHGRDGSIASSEDCSLLEDDLQVVSLQVLTSANSQHNVRKAYQSMINMLDRDLPVIGELDKYDFPDMPRPPKKGSSEHAIPCLATVLFFNGCQEDSQSTQYVQTPAKSIDSFSKPDLLLNHAWNGCQELERDFARSIDLNDNDIMEWKRFKKPKKYPIKSWTNAPFLHFESILKESEENECNKDDVNLERDIGFRKGIFDFEVSERTLVARKQLETWPWEFHHKADSKKGITQCHWNIQDFYSYQPDRDVMRLYGDVIDTRKINRRGMPRYSSEDSFVRTGEDSDATSCSSKYSDVETDRRSISTTDFPLLGVREVHYGKQHLRYTLFVSDTNWIYQVEFYRMLLRGYEVTLRGDFCYFTVHCGKNTDVQFALKKLGSNQKPLPLCSTVLQFKVQNVGGIVPLLPNACMPVMKNKWKTTDHDGNIILLHIIPYNSSNISDTMSTTYDRDLLPLDDTVTSLLEARQSSDEEDNLSLERLDSFMEPELPERMPLLQRSMYSNLPGKMRFSNTYTSSHSAGSSTSTSPERRPRRYLGQTDMRYSLSPMDIGYNRTLPSPKNKYNFGSFTSRISESSEDPEITNSPYRRARSRREGKRQNDRNSRSGTRHRSKSSSRTAKYKQKDILQQNKPREEEVIVYV